MISLSNKTEKWNCDSDVKNYTTESWFYFDYWNEKNTQQGVSVETEEREEREREREKKREWMKKGKKEEKRERMNEERERGRGEWK